MSVSVQEYYQTITEQDIGAVAHELLGVRVTEQNGAVLHCNCPHHQSISKRSLHISTDKQQWYCFGCGVGGDVLQLVEFVHSGDVSVGKSGEMSQSHRDARDWLAARINMPALASYGLSPEELQKQEINKAYEMRVLAALQGMVEIYHSRLKEHPEVMAWIKEKYSISEETMNALKIGYADNDVYKRGITKPLRECSAHFTTKELCGTGAFKRIEGGKCLPFFQKRVVFPYWHRGRVVFAIGRKTPWTEESVYELAKYKKLPVVSDKNEEVSACINNNLLYNEDCLATSPDYVVLTEGVTDCIMLMQHGFPTVSPVTVRIRGNDWQRIIPKLRKVGMVYICQDNEVSEAGLKGALNSAGILSRAGIPVRIITLPLGEKQHEARKKLKKNFNYFEMEEVHEKGQLSGVKEEDKALVQELLADAKIDVAEYFAEGHSTEDFERLIAEAQAPLEFGINALPSSVDDCPEAERNQRIGTVLFEIAREQPLEQDRLLRQLQDKLGDVSPAKSLLKAQIKLAEKDHKKQLVQEQRQAKCKELIAEQGTLRALIEEQEMEAKLEGRSSDYTVIAKQAFEWFRNNGGRFYYSPQGEPFMYFDNAIYWMDTSEKCRKRAWYAMIFKQTGLVSTMQSCKTFLEVLANLAIDQGQPCGNLSWLHTDMKNYVVFFNLNNNEHQIAKITSEGVEIVQNGGNTDNVILDCSQKIQPITYLPDANRQEAEQCIAELIIQNFTCSPLDRLLIISWLSCFLLIDYAGTRPMTRFEGVSGSGKSSASKMISALLYGTEEQKKATDAANYADGSQNPLIILDNIESKQMTEELTTFMLTSITGIAREKRRSGTDSETVVERTKCLLNTNGIEPLCADLSEIQSRAFIINFDIENQANACFLEKPLIEKIKQARNLILSSIMQCTSKALGLIRDGVLERVMELLSSELGKHGKQRCNNYIALMYVMLLAQLSEEDREVNLKKLLPEFVEQLQGVIKSSHDILKDSNPIAIALNRLFDAYRTALELDLPAGGFASSSVTHHVDSFIERYQISFDSETEMRPLSAGSLLAAMKRISRDFDIEFPYGKPEQLARRIKNDMEILQAAGFVVARIENKKRCAFDYQIAISAE